jgi:hypothetical protein
MNKFYILAVLFYISNASAQKQEITLDGLITCSTMKPEPLSEYLKHKGFKAYTDSLNTGLSFLRCSKDKTEKQIIGRSENTACITISLQTTSEAEFLNWQQELQKNDFHTYKEKGNTSPNIVSFQKRNLKARLCQLQNSKPAFYSIVLESKKLPTPNEFQYAEDLLQLTSHEYIAAVFGTTNVKEDLFYFSEKEVSKCSILFPNTSNQVFFIWNDEENRQDISFLILGGISDSDGNSSIFNGNQFHRWRSSQGIHLGMSLKELQTLNGQPLEFYGWDTDQPGFIVKKNNGHINFQSLGVQLQCLDCYKSDISNSAPILSSESVLNANDRVFVNTLMILPKTEAMNKNK